MNSMFLESCVVSTLQQAPVICERSRQTVQSLTAAPAAEPSHTLPGPSRRVYMIRTIPVAQNMNSTQMRYTEREFVVRMGRLARAFGVTGSRSSVRQVEDRGCHRL